MTAILLIAGATVFAVLLTAIVLDSTVSARASEPAPRQFSLFLRLFLAFQMASFVLSAFATGSDSGSEVWRNTRFSLFFFFALEELRRGFSAVLVWYLPRFLFVSLGLVYSTRKKRPFLALLILIGAMKIVVIDAQAVAYWMKEYDGFARAVLVVEDIVTLPLFYSLCVYLIVTAARHLKRPVPAFRRPYFWGLGFLASLVVFLLADFAERLFTDPFLSRMLGGEPAAMAPFPFLSLSGLVLGISVIKRATASLRRAFTQLAQPPVTSCKERFAEYGLTPREAEIAGLLLKGYVNKEIAARLNIGYGTVKNHAYSLYGKLGITSRFELIKLLETPTPR